MMFVKNILIKNDLIGASPNTPKKKTNKFYKKKLFKITKQQYNGKDLFKVYINYRKT